MNKIIRSNNFGVSFLYTYPFWSTIIFISLLINYLFFRSIFIKENSIFFLINSIINYGIFTLFFFLLLYKFYNFIFINNFFISSLGIIFLFSAVMKLYISNVVVSNILDLIFFISTISICSYILLRLIFMPDMIEYKRGVYVFILIALLSSSLHFIFITLNSIIDISFFSFLSYHIGNYTEKVSSMFFIILFIIYMLFAVKEVLVKNIHTSSYISIIILSLSLFLIYKYSNIFYLFITSFYNSFAVSLYFSQFIYLVFMLLFLLIIISSTITLFITKQYSYSFILFSLLIISGLDMSNFTFRFISIFSLLELYSIESNNFTNTEKVF